MLGFLPQVASAPIAPTLTILAVTVGMVALAVFDILREEVEDYATAALLLLTLGALLWEGVSAGQWAGGALAAALAFSAYLLLGMAGVVGGGDVKLSVVPALVLGIGHPLIGVWWVAASLLIQHGFFLVARLTASAGRAGVPTLPHVPAMATAFLAAWVLFLP